MNENESKDFSEIWITACEGSLYSKRPSNGSINVAFDLLKENSLDYIRRAISIHTRSSENPPTVSGILNIIQIRSQHISGDEAWALCPSSELDSVVWTKEIARAYSVAYKEIGKNRTSAKFTFKKAYDRAIKEAKNNNTLPIWYLSVGSDKDRIKDVIDQGMAMRRISPQYAKKSLLSRNLTMDGGVIGKLLTGKKLSGDELSRNKANIKKIRGIIDQATKNANNKEEKKRKEAELRASKARNYAQGIRNAQVQ